MSQFQNLLERYAGLYKRLHLQLLGQVGLLEEIEDDVLQGMGQSSLRYFALAIIGNVVLQLQEVSIDP